MKKIKLNLSQTTKETVGLVGKLVGTMLITPATILGFGCVASYLKNNYNIDISQYAMPSITFAAIAPFVVFPFLFHRRRIVESRTSSLTIEDLNKRHQVCLEYIKGQNWSNKRENLNEHYQECLEYLKGINWSNER